MRSEFYTVVDDEYGRLKFEFWNGMVFLHFKPKTEPKIAMWRLLHVRKEIAALLRAFGFAKVHAYFRESDVVARLCLFLGFRCVDHRNGWMLMEAENA